MDYGFDVNQDYFQWLCELIGANRPDGRSYWLLMKDLFRKEFYSLIPHDENRESDGLELREEYLSEINYPRYFRFEKECSVLEMLIALSRRIDYETGDPYDFGESDDGYRKWFWEMVDNLGLMDYDDENYVDYGGFTQVDGILDNFLERGYAWDGFGGLFPLTSTDIDQREIEIWYQMSAYLDEKGVI